MTWIYERSPLSRVAFTVDFALEPFSSNMFGLYWTRIKARFPISEQERAPTLTASDRNGDYLYGELPPLRRVTYESINRSRVLELQDGRLTYIWRRTQDELQYPRFSTLRRQMIDEWNFFVEAVVSELGVPPTVLQCVLSYRNEFDGSLHWRGPGDTPRFLRFVGSVQGWNPRSEHCFVEFDSEIGEVLLGTEDSEYRSAPDHRKPPTSQYFDLRAQSKPTEGIDLSWFDLAHEELGKLFYESLTDCARSVLGATEEAMTR